MKKTKVIVTGGAGFIGSNLTNELVRQGYNVHVVDTLVAGNKDRIPKKATLHKVDIRETDKLTSIFKGAQYVFHLAALPRVQYSIENPVETNKVNVDGTLSVLVAAKDAHVKKVIYSASSSAYGDQPKMPLVETMPASPKSPYGLQKYIGELMCSIFSSVYGLPTVSLRYFNVYGPGQSDEGAYALVIAKFLKQKNAGQPLTITGTGKQTRDFTHVRDVVQANILAMKSAKVGTGEVMNIGAGRNVSVAQIAKIIGGSVKHIPARLEPQHTLADTTKARKLIGWNPTVSLEEGIQELMK